MHCRNCCKRRSVWNLSRPINLSCFKRKYRVDSTVVLSFNGSFHTHRYGKSVELSQTFTAKSKQAERRDTIQSFVNLARNLMTVSKEIDLFLITLLGVSILLTRIQGFLNKFMYVTVISSVFYSFQRTRRFKQFLLSVDDFSSAFASKKALILPNGAYRVGIWKKLGYACLLSL